jgi:hypothetical protein
MNEQEDRVRIKPGNKHETREKVKGDSVKIPKTSQTQIMKEPERERKEAQNDDKYN